MRIEVISDEEFFIFANSLYAKINNYDDKDEIVQTVREIISKVRVRLKLRGFYKIKVFINSKVGLFIEGIRLESLDRGNVVDLRVVVYFDEDIYFKTDDYFIIKDIPGIRYYDGSYYCLVNNILDLNKVIEYGEFVYGNYLFEMLENSVSV